MRILMLANPGSVHSQRWSAGLAARGHEVLLAGIRGAEIPGVTLALYGPGRPAPQGRAMQAAGYAALGFGLARLARRFRPDVVNAHFAATNGVLAALAGLRPRVVNIWGSDVIWDGAGAMPWGRRLLVRMALERADRVLSTTDFMLARTRPLLRRMPPAEVIRWGVDCDRFTPSRDLAKPLGSSPVTLGWVKTFAQKYAPDLFLEAAAIAAREAPELRFVMAGKGPGRAAAEAMAHRLGIAERVSFPGFVAQADLPKLLQSFDILVNSSRWPSESYGVVLVEAAACGLATIATDVGGVREAMIPDETGLLAPSEDPAALATAMLMLARDPERRAAMGAAGRRIVERDLDWQDTLTRHEAVLAEAAAAKG